jgi:putative transposase
MAAHVAGKDDVLVQAAPLLKEIGDWRWLLRGEEAEDVHGALRRHERTGRPLGSPQFLEQPENRPRRVFLHPKPGPKPKGDK